MFESFGIQRFVTRWLAAMFLVLATYNPSGYSYYHWVSGLDFGNWILKLLVALVLGILYATFGLATRRSLGRLGIAAWLLFFAVVTWMMVDLGLIRIAGSGSMATIALVDLANLLAVGLSWSYIRARLSGQADTNNVTLP
jgi:uncharacterized protein DUF6524